MTPTRLIMNYSNGYMLPLIQTYKYICGVCVYMYMYVVGCSAGIANLLVSWETNSVGIPIRISFWLYMHH